MLARKLGLAAFAAAAALFPSASAQDDDDSSRSVQSTFVSPDTTVAFAFSIPDNDDEDFYFAMRVRRSVAWGAVGLGSDDMPGALYLMIYENHDGDDVIFSPRLSYGHYEPKYYPDLEFEKLNGTRIDNKHMIYVGRCVKHCRSWPGHKTQGGRIDVSSSSEKAIYAFGPEEGFASDNIKEDLKFHEQFGIFTIDMGRTHGATEPPELSGSSRSEGTTLEWHKDGAADTKSIAHAVVMIFCMVGLMPIGVILLRFGNWVRWHGINQTVAMVGVLIGFVLGILTSFRYQRSLGFDSYHQILGIMVTVFILGQFALGFLHHRKYKQTGQPTKYGMIHLWTGRLILLLGIMNAFFGLTFAMNRRYGIVLAALIIVVCFASLAFIVGRRWLENRRRGGRAGLAGAGHPHGARYNGMPGNHSSPQPYVPGQSPPNSPWRTENQPTYAGHPSDAPPGYEASNNSQQHIGLQPVTPWQRQERGDEYGPPHIGGAQTPREFT